jgi:hypothetical protein
MSPPVAEAAGDFVVAENAFLEAQFEEPAHGFADLGTG